MVAVHSHEDHSAAAEDQVRSSLVEEEVELASASVAVCPRARIVARWLAVLRAEENDSCSRVEVGIAVAAKESSCSASPQGAVLDSTSSSGNTYDIATPEALYPLLAVSRLIVGSSVQQGSDTVAKHDCERPRRQRR